MADFDPVQRPQHYNSGKVECIDALEAATTGLVGIEAVCTANAIKYLWRWKQKNGVEDLQKAKWYIDRLIGIAALPPSRNFKPGPGKCVRCSKMEFLNSEGWCLACFSSATTEKKP